MEPALPPLLFFDRESDARRERRLRAAVAEKPKKEKRLFCATCKHPITHQDERIAVNGGHEHRFTNPHGLRFHIGCFRRAPGCTEIGAATLEHTWFPGFAWRIALCAHCRAHLGWCFRAAEDGFHGLITNRLTCVGGGR